MSINWNTLENSSRLLLEVELEPVQGQRFQPTGFPDLGAAEYTAPSTDGSTTSVVLIESAQSVANRLEAVCWDHADDQLHPVLSGMPYVNVALWDSGKFTNSILEAHRLNSPYILDDDTFKEQLRQQAQLPEQRTGVFDVRSLAKAAFRYDPGSVLHGVFLEKLAGRARLQRTLSGFVEARGAEMVTSGGVKNDRVSPSGMRRGAAEGFGNVPFHRTEYVADSITAYFSVDLAQIRAYGLGQNGEQFLMTLALWKVRRFLDEGLRLRTACDLEPVGGLSVKRPNGFEVPEIGDLESELSDLIASCANEGLFADPPITNLTFIQ